MSTESETKVCPMCLASKPYGDYGSNRSSPDGLETYCVSCKRVYRRLKRKGYDKETIKSIIRGELDEAQAPTPATRGQLFPSGASTPNKATMQEILKQYRDQGSAGRTKYPSDLWKRHAFIIRKEYLEMIHALADYNHADITETLDRILSDFFQGKG